MKEYEKNLMIQTADECRRMTFTMHRLGLSEACARAGYPHLSALTFETPGLESYFTALNIALSRASLHRIQLGNKAHVPHISPSSPAYKMMEEIADIGVQNFQVTREEKNNHIVFTVRNKLTGKKWEMIDVADIDAFLSLEVYWSVTNRPQL